MPDLLVVMQMQIIIGRDVDIDANAGKVADIDVELDRNADEDTNRDVDIIH